MDKFIGKVVLVQFTKVIRPRFRWIVRKREDGRFIVRVPKIGVAIRDLNLLRDKDFNKEVLLEKGSKPFSSSTRRSKKSSGKTRKSKMI